MQLYSKLFGLIKNFLVLLKRRWLKIKINRMKDVKIIAGAGNVKIPSWISTNKEEFDITNESDFLYYFSNKKVSNILLEHVIEHILYEEFLKFLKIAKKYLKKGGVIRIAVPDKYHPSEYVRQLTGVNGLEPGAEDHKYFYSIDDLEEIAAKTGYRLVKLEYFDADGYFHTTDFDFSNGYVFRCSKNYKGRFTNSVDEYIKMLASTPEHLRSQFLIYKISYTSLLVDLINENE